MNEWKIIQSFKKKKPLIYKKAAVSKIHLCQLKEGRFKDCTMGFHCLCQGTQESWRELSCQVSTQGITTVTT